MSGTAGDALREAVAKLKLNVGAPSTVVESTSWLPTGNLAIDFVCGGGLPVGRSMELYGQESSGKTTTALQAAALLQRRLIDEGRDEAILYLDFEHSFDEDYAAALGIDTEHPTFLLGQPPTMEDGAEAALKLIDSDAIRLTIWDSVAAMAPLSRLEGDFDQRTAAMNKARLMSGLLLQLTPRLKVHRCTGVFINHLMEAIDMNSHGRLPPKVTTPGGKALKFYASLRLEYRQIGITKATGTDVLTGESGQQATATMVRVKCVKSKVGPPQRTADVCVRYGQGFDNYWSALQILVAYGVVRKTSAWYRFDGELAHPDMERPGKSGPSLNGEAAVLAFAAENPIWGAGLVDTAELLLETKGSAPTTADPVSDDDLAELGAEDG